MPNQLWFEASGSIRCIAAIAYCARYRYQVKPNTYLTLMNEIRS